MKASFKHRFQIVDDKAKRRISKRVFQENKPSQIFWKTNISYPLKRTRTCGYQGVRNVHFSENLTCFVFLKHPFWDSPFCLITDVFKVVISFAFGSALHRFGVLNINKVVLFKMIIEDLLLWYQLFIIYVWTCFSHILQCWKLFQ